MDKMKFDLVISIVNDGFSGEVLKYANEITKVTGTILKGRAGSDKKDQDILGGIYSEKETVMIVVDKENKNAIMQNISNHLGLASNAQGLIFSVPLEDYLIETNKENEENESKKDSVEVRGVEDKDSNAE